MRDIVRRTDDPHVEVVEDGGGALNRSRFALDIQPEGEMLAALQCHRGFRRLLDERQVCRQRPPLETRAVVIERDQSRLTPMRPLPKLLSSPVVTGVEAGEGNLVANLAQLAGPEWHRKRNDDDVQDIRKRKENCRRGT